MKLFRVVPFLMFAAFPALLFAQGGSNTGGAGGEASTFQGVENVAAQGGFVGVSNLNAFVGITEIYAQSGGTGRSSSGSSRLTTTAARPRAVSTAQRQPARAPGASTLGGANSQTIRSSTSLDSDVASLAVRTPTATLESQLTRIQGIQDGHISFTSLPAGATAVLTGTVASNNERRVAQQLLLLQPGINRVDNRLEIR